MDDQPKVVDRDLKRDFLISRYSPSVQAKAFQILGEFRPPVPIDGSEQTTPDHSSKRPLQEAQ